MDTKNDEHGNISDLQIVTSFPQVPSWNLMFMLEAMTFKLEIRLGNRTNNMRQKGGKFYPGTIIVQAWTNIYQRENPEGVWHGIDLDYIEEDKQTGNHTYGKSVMLTSPGQFRFTFRVKQKEDIHITRTDSGADWQWANDYMVDGVVDVSPPKDEKWSHGPNYDHIYRKVYLGNFIAATVADQHGFDAVLNVADNLDLVPGNFATPVMYKKISMADGAGNAIPEDKLREGIDWLITQDKNPDVQQLLVNCRAGIGRAGSVVVGFVFAMNPELTYAEAYNLVFERRFVYPHKGLKDSLYSLYPRGTEQCSVPVQVSW